MRQTSWRDCLAVCAMAGVGLFVLLSFSCSHEQHDRWMRFFFDVPDQSAAATPSASAPREELAGTDSLTKTKREPVLASDPAWKRLNTKPTSMHPPFVKRQCSTCHEVEKQMAVSEKFMDECRDCHEDYFSDAVGHPPVKKEQCLKCHEPHVSEQTSLLSRPVFNTCMLCHKKPERLSEEMHSRPDVQQCTKCHDPHFGTGVLIKKSAPPEAVAAAGAESKGDETPESALDSDAASMPSDSKPLSIHAPFAKQQCAACHEVEKQMAVSEKFMGECRDCHEDFFGDQITHPPVKKEQCLKCHEPHKSDLASLLVRPVFNTCMVCHEEPERLSAKMHSRPDVQDCTKCHDPHFGTGFMIKKTAPPEAQARAAKDADKEEKAEEKKE